MGIKCEILPVRPKIGIYKSGQVITGVVKYSLDKSMRIPNIVLFFKGKLKGKNFWLERRENLKKKEEFVSMHKIIQEDRQNNLEAGDYVYPFEFQLPEELPTSYRDETCTISYKLSVEFMVPESFNRIKKFKIEVPIYGNVKPLSDEPVTAGLTKNAFPMHKPIDLEVNIEKPFVIAGDNIILDCVIYNDADIPVTGIKTKLIEETIYKYSNGRKKVQRYDKDGTAMEFKGAKENSEAKVFCVVPTSWNAYTIQNSKYFSRGYKVKVTATFPFPHIPTSVDVPVVIQANDCAMLVRDEQISCWDCVKAIIL